MDDRFREAIKEIWVGKMDEAVLITENVVKAVRSASTFCREKAEQRLKDCIDKEKNLRRLMVALQRL